MSPYDTLLTTNLKYDFFFKSPQEDEKYQDVSVDTTPDKKKCKKKIISEWQVI